MTYDTINDAQTVAGGLEGRRTSPQGSDTQVEGGGAQIEDCVESPQQADIGRKKRYVWTAFLAVVSLGFAIAAFWFSIGNKTKAFQLWKGGPYWADRNIGAERPEDYGYYFWWGDTVGYKRVNNDWVASDGATSGFSFFCGKNTPTYGKSVDASKSEGWITADGFLASTHDAAQKHWGGEWRMPTKQELHDLCEKCDWKWTRVNGVEGYIVSGRGDYASNSIFLPCAGIGDGT